MNAKRIACKAAKTFAVFLISVLVLSLLVFVVSRLAPGDPLVSFYGERAEKLKPAERAAAEARLGLDQPILRQYALWLKGALRGEFGISYKYKMDVLEVIRARLPFTLCLGGIGFLLTFFLALGLGVLCARHEDKGLDRALCKIGTVTSCIPEFWMSLMLILIFAVSLRVLPSSGAYDVGKADDLGSRITHLILPLTVVVLGHLWYYAYMVRNKMLEEMRMDYVLLAKSKGLGRKKILYRHCLRNVLPSYLSIMAISVPHVLGGTYIVESVFSYPGLGTLSYESARYKDYTSDGALHPLRRARHRVQSSGAGAERENRPPHARAGGHRHMGGGYRWMILPSSAQGRKTRFRFPQKRRGIRESRSYQSSFWD